MRTTKLNKTQTLELMLSTVTNTINSHHDLLKKDKAELLIELLSAELSHSFAPKQGGTHNNKVNAEGEVYCNYFDAYYAPTEFNTKLSKPNAEGVRTEGYKANCVAAEQILRKVKTVRKNVEKQAMTNFMDKTITADEMEEMLIIMEQRLDFKFLSAEDVPTVAEIVGLNGDTTDAKPVRG